MSAIRIEWCKIHTRAHCWAEEVELLFEEQWHVLEFLHWQAKWWMDRQNLVMTDNSVINKGLRSYALQQAAFWDELAKHFMHIWCKTERYKKLASDDRGTDSEVWMEE